MTGRTPCCEVVVGIPPSPAYGSPSMVMCSCGLRWWPRRSPELQQLDAGAVAVTPLVEWIAAVDAYDLTDLLRPVGRLL